MLACLYVETLLTDEELANQVWESWGAGVITKKIGSDPKGSDPIFLVW